VERAFIRGEEVFISSGLNPGDTVITTRLVDPLDNALVEIVGEPPADSAGAPPEPGSSEERDPA
jgi:hypothetical protein